MPTAWTARGVVWVGKGGVATVQAQFKWFTCHCLLGSVAMEPAHTPPQATRQPLTHAVRLWPPHRSIRRPGSSWISHHSVFQFHNGKCSLGGSGLGPFTSPQLQQGTGAAGCPVTLRQSVTSWRARLRRNLRSQSGLRCSNAHLCWVHTASELPSWVKLQVPPMQLNTSPRKHLPILAENDQGPGSPSRRLSPPM